MPKDSAIVDRRPTCSSISKEGDSVPSRTQFLTWVKDWKAKEVEAGLAEDAKLLDWRDERGRNFLHVCCGVNVKQRGRQASHSVRTADALLAAGLDLNREAFREHSWKATPLWYAIARGENLALARHLLELGSDPNHCLWAASFRSDLAAIRLLLDHGAEIDAIAEGETPFLGAVKVSHFDAAELLLQRGADPNFRDAKGMTALHYMLKKGSDKSHLRMVIRHGARGDIANAKGETAAQLLARKRDPELAKLAARIS
jgi:ankyrin repeat protein